MGRGEVEPPTSGRKRTRRSGTRIVLGATALTLLALSAAWTTVEGSAHAGAPPAAPARLASAHVAPNAREYRINFTSLGLPKGTTWGISLDQSLNQTTGTYVTFNELSGTYTYNVTGGRTFVASNQTGKVVVNTAPVNVTIRWNWTYSINFTESNLPKAATWHVYLDLFEKAAPAGGAIVYHEVNATWNFNAGSNLLWVPSPQNGIVRVNGFNLSVHVNFTPPVPRYTLSFQESGLPVSASWYVNVNGYAGGGFVAAGATVQLMEVNGTYVYSDGSSNGYVGHPSAGSAVVNGTNVSKTIVFAPPYTNRLTFTESGLTAGNWGVSVDSHSPQFGAAGATIAFDVLNGTHNYTVSPVAGYTIAPTSGSLPIYGAPTQQSITFVPVAFPVTFQEQGLPNGSWWVVVNGTNLSGAAGTSLVISMASGYYLYQVGDDAGYVSPISSGTVDVAKAPATVIVSFSPKTVGQVPGSGGGTSPPPTLLYVAVGAGAAAVAVLGYFLWRRRTGHSSTRSSSFENGESGGGR